jgi:hypothetical protein
MLHLWQFRHTFRRLCSEGPRPPGRRLRSGEFPPHPVVRRVRFPRRNGLALGARFNRSGSQPSLAFQILDAMDATEMNFRLCARRIFSGHPARGEHSVGHPGGEVLIGQRSRETQARG